MRINAHAHIFNLRSVFTPETMHILLNRLKLEGMPKSVLDVLYQRLEGFLRKEVDAEAIFKTLDERVQATDELSALFGKLKPGDVDFDLQIDGVLAKLGKTAAKYLRGKILDLYDLDPDGEIRQDLLDYVEYLRIALLPSIDKVTEEVMAQMQGDDALVALSMDITDGTDDGTLYARQLSAMSDAVLAFPGRLFPFVMVNPLRNGYDVIMRDAIEKKGFWGVKLYPSLGYPVFSDKMSTVYRYCVENNIPILTHCTDLGFRRDKASGQMASPAEWTEVLEAFPDLKVCFGHFGADDTLVQDSIPDGSWPAMIVDLMNRYANVYADISFHTDAMIGTRSMDKQTARRNYAHNIKSLLNTSPCKNRLLFGTDFWLVRTVAKDRDYWAFFEKMLTPAQFNRLAQANPVDYLGLPGAAKPSYWLVERYLSFFKTKKMKVQRKPAKWVFDALAASGDAAEDFVVVGTAPSWSPNNWIHYILFEYLYGGRVYREADREPKLPFEEYGRFKLANLSYWDESAEPAIFDVAVKGMASDINKVYMKRYRKWVSYNKDLAITEAKARKELVSALKKADWYVYQLAELCDALYIFDRSKLEGGGDA